MDIACILLLHIAGSLRVSLVIEWKYGNGGEGGGLAGS